jgi:hypothetical protein
LYESKAEDRLGPEVQPLPIFEDARAKRSQINVNMNEIWLKTADYQGQMVIVEEPQIIIVGEQSEAGGGLHQPRVDE